MSDNKRQSIERLLTLLDKKEWSTAERLLKELLETYKRDSDLWRIQAQLLLDRHAAVEEAENALIESLSLDSDNREALLLMGKLLAVHKKEVEAARKYFERILTKYPTDYRSLTNVGATYVEAKAFTKAMRFFEAALSARRDEIHASYGLAHCLFVTGNYRMAFDRALTALTVNPWRKEDAAVRQQASGLMLHLTQKLIPLTDFRHIADSLRHQLGNSTEHLDPIATPFPTTYMDLFKEAETLLRQTDKLNITIESGDIRLFERKESEWVGRLFNLYPREMVRKQVRKQLRLILDYLQDTADELLIHAFLHETFQEIRPSELWSLFESQQKGFETAKAMGNRPSPFERVRKHCLMLKTLELERLYGIRLLGQYAVTHDEYDRLMENWESLLPYLSSPRVEARREIMVALIKGQDLDDCLHAVAP